MAALTSYSFNQLRGAWKILLRLFKIDTLLYQHQKMACKRKTVPPRAALQGGLGCMLFARSEVSLKALYGVIADGHYVADTVLLMESPPYSYMGAHWLGAPDIAW
jgi:hypothetical protein